MRNKPIDTIEEKDLRDFIAQKIGEDRGIDYKETLNLNKSEEINKFLKPICAFANTAGGWLIYGIKEERDEENKQSGIPEAITGCGMDNADEIKKRIENYLYEQIEPRILGVRIKTLSLKEGTVVLIKVPFSHYRPHALKQGKQFYARADSRVYQMGPEELRHSFLGSRDRISEMRLFRERRVFEIAADNTPVRLKNSQHKIIVHFIPFYPIAIDVNARFDDLHPLAGDGHERQINFDGILHFSMDTTYLQLFRDGVIESATVRMGGMFGISPAISSLNFERKIINLVGSAMKFFQQVQMPMPIAMYISLVGVKGVYWGYEDFLRDINPQPFDRDTLLFPEVIFENCGEAVDKKLKQVFDVIWQAAGYEKSHFYDRDGERIK